MERGVAFLTLLFSSAASFSNQIILECGLTTRNGFNGWSVEPYTAFTNITFTEETISFYVENGGDYSIVLTRKIESMKEFSSLNLSFGFSNFENCTLNHVDVFASTDNKIWENIKLDQEDYETAFENPKGFDIPVLAFDCRHESVRHFLGTKHALLRTRALHHRAPLAEDDPWPVGPARHHSVFRQI